MLAVIGAVHGLGIRFELLPPSDHELRFVFGPQQSFALWLGARPSKPGRGNGYMRLDGLCEGSAADSVRGVEQDLLERPRQVGVPHQARGRDERMSLQVTSAMS
jgi:hypothetical protein